MAPKYVAKVEEVDAFLFKWRWEVYAKRNTETKTAYDLVYEYPVKEGRSRTQMGAVSAAAKWIRLRRARLALEAQRKADAVTFIPD